MPNEFFIHTNADESSKPNNIKDILKKVKGPKPKTEDLILKNFLKRLDFKIITTNKFPSLKGITALKSDCKKYFHFKRVYINKYILNSIFSAIEMGKPICFYSEPGTGKSLIAKTFLDWLTLKSPIVKDKKKIMGWNYFQFRVGDIPRSYLRSGYGFGWNSININPETTKIDLFGGLIPESFGSDKDRSELVNVIFMIRSKLFFHR